MIKGRPIKPDEIPNFEKKEIPGFVFDAVNTLLIRTLAEKRDNVEIQVSEVRQLIKAEMSVVMPFKTCVFQSWWFDFEEEYLKAGWKVTHEGRYPSKMCEGCWHFAKAD